jgi:predicted Zn-dependent protease
MATKTRGLRWRIAHHQVHQGRLRLNEVSENTGNLEEAMGHARHMLAEDPRRAIIQLDEVLLVVPDYPPALLLKATAINRIDGPEASLELLAPLAEKHGQWPAVHFEYAKTLSVLKHGEAAIRALETVVALEPEHPEAWRMLADHLAAIGEQERSESAYLKHLRCSTQNPELQQAAKAMIDNNLSIAERVLKSHLQRTPTDVTAVRMLAEVAVRVGRNEEAQSLLEYCLELAPGFSGARYNLAVLLHRTNKSNEALVEVEKLLEEDPRRPGYRNLAAVICSRIGEYERSSQLYQALLEEYPENAKVWLSFAHVLKTEGKREQCEAAYRRAIERDGSFGEAYWSLANLKTLRFSAEDIEQMNLQIHRSDIDLSSQVQFHFALGKAAEDNREHDLSFHHYEKGNSLHKSTINYQRSQNAARVERMKSRFTQSFFEERKGLGCSEAGPIFIVGMPRAGSTLLEQILASHSQVEGTTELPDIITLAKELRARAEEDEIGAYDGVLARMTQGELEALGRQYLERTLIHRKTDSPFFIDKMPNNFLHIGLIQVCLPNAKIIDARRHPLACCFSNFKQYFARGQNFSYSLEDVGHFYRDYVELMTHYDKVLPGRIHRVIYESLVGDIETEVRSVLKYCGLPFEEGCLRFFENKRPVRTASSEQVRQPIYRDGVEQWRAYEAHLAPLKSALGDVLTAYPAPPERA